MYIQNYLQNQRNESETSKGPDRDQINMIESCRIRTPRSSASTNIRGITVAGIAIGATAIAIGTWEVSLIDALLARSAADFSIQAAAVEATVGIRRATAIRQTAAAISSWATECAGARTEPRVAGDLAQAK